MNNTTNKTHTNLPRYAKSLGMGSNMSTYW